LPLAVAVIIGVLAMMPPRRSAMKAGFDRIKMRMTKTEVETILGKAGFWTSYPMGPTEIGGWNSEDGEAALISFGSFGDGGVISKQWRPSNGAFFDRFRRWLHLE
jgi:hypothetical protein